jgi:hypothetical protein
MRTGNKSWFPQTTIWLIVIAFAGWNGVFAQQKPVVVGTQPPNDATGVSRYLASVSMTFSKDMNTSYCGAATTNWTHGGPGSSCFWSADKRTMTLTRETPVTAINFLTRITFNLNPDWMPQAFWLRDSEGNLLDAYTFSFTIEDRPQPVKVPSNSQKGFSWPYYLYIPSTIKNPPVLTVEPNNTGAVSDDFSVHDKAANDLILWKREWADAWGVPYLVPVFPRPAFDPFMYTHALDRKTLQTTLPGYQRIDLQLIAMIADARARLAAQSIDVDPKVFMTGMSASGSFVSRFVMLHPDVVKAASIGAPGFGPIVPVVTWNNQTLTYPVGIADLDMLVGRGFDGETFRTVPLQVWVGDEDLVGSYWRLSDPEVALVSATFGGVNDYDRWPIYELVYHSAGSNCQFVIFPGMGHTFPDLSYLTEFFERNHGSPMPPLPKPQLYKIYFPHVASFSGWDTEIAVLNTVPGGEPVRGKLQTYGAAGNLLQSADIEIQPGGRKEITIGSFFQNPADIAYLALVSDSGYLAGYTRFSQPGNRTSLIAAVGANHGWFTKVENEGWTGIAFVNVDTAKANVTLTGSDDAGNQVAEVSIGLAPGIKSIALIGELFKLDAARITYVRWVSDKKIVGFTVSGSADATMLDGLHSLGQYVPSP